MRTALCADELAELRHIHGGVASAVQPGKAAAFMHKADKAAQHLGIGENLTVAAVHKYRIVIQDFWILQVVDIVAEDCLIGAGGLRHLLNSEVGMGCGVVVVSTRRSYIDYKKLPGHFGSYQRLFG